MNFYHFFKNLIGGMLKIIYRVNYFGKENIIEDSKMIVCSNHTNYFDPIILATAFNKRHLHFMAKKSLFKYKPIGAFIRKLGTFPVDREGADLSAIKKALKILKEDKVLGIFPEGTRVIKDRKSEAKPGVAMIAVKSKSPVIPVYIDTNYKIFSKVNVYIGKPIFLSAEKKGKITLEEYKKLSDNILQEIYALKEIHKEVKN
ncbi:MAG: lysophospholipid acyltransferase family protein [Senegalia sp. (in: firmicutes)]|uniref:lysophospholipid acyltransferase family protein n=1 Tax=Senegalia sp. (in: firmicutes) TaxID=1924098 RepID=UPI003F9D85BA